MSKFFALITLIIGMSGQIFAQPPECPIFKNKKDCLQSVNDNYNKYRKYIDEMMDEEDPTKTDDLILTSLDIKKYESLACEKTCLN